MSKGEVIPAKGISTSRKLSPPRIDTLSQPEADLNLSAKLYSALRMLRAILLKEAGEGVMAYHIFGNATVQQISKRIPRTKEELLEINGIGKAKISKYGDRLLETIESTVNEYYKKEKGNSSSNDSTDSIKRRRDTKRDCNGNLEEDDGNNFIRSTGRSKKRVAENQNKIAEVSKCIEAEYYNQCLMMI